MTLSHLDDEALSAALDGEATAEERAHLDGCRSCRERFDQLQAVASVVATPVPARPAAAAETAVLAALASTDERTDRHPAAATTVTAFPAGPRRAVSDWRGSRLAQVLLAAAAAVVVVAGVGLLASRGGSSSKTSSVAERSPVAASPTTEASSGAAGANTAQATSSIAPRPPSAASAFNGQQAAINLGDQTDAVALAHIVDAQLRSGSTSSAAGLTNRGPGAPLCVDQGAAAAGTAGQHPALSYVAFVRWRSQDAIVLVYAQPNGRPAGVVMRRSDCASLARLPL